MHFSTRNIPQRLRKDAVEAAFGAHVRGSVDFPPDEAVAVDINFRELSGVHLAHIDSSPLRLVTPPDRTGLLYLGITRAGGGVIDAHGDSTMVKAGDVNLMCRGRLITTVVAEQSTILSLAIPRAQLLPRLANNDSLQPSAPLSMPAARLLESYAMALFSANGSIAPDEETVFARHLVDLAVLMLGGRRDEAELARQNGARAARRQAIKADIAAHLGMPELSLTSVARRHGVSPSYVRSLFYDEGTSFTDYVLGARLDYVRDLLAEPRLQQRTIAAIALTAGFGDISWFNEAFRRRFGMTPSDMRAGSSGK
ncbi:MAG TPA: AraC family transcriptional regulator [Rhizobiaceae bacterium]|nr:AraC family transcriptional regulator [Rhizobiaceae bacterium]